MIKKNVLIFWTGIQRSAETILKDQSLNKNKNREKLIGLRELTDNFYENLISNNNSFYIPAVRCNLSYKFIYHLAMAMIYNRYSN